MLYYLKKILMTLGLLLILLYTLMRQAQLAKITGEIQTKEFIQVVEVKTIQTKLNGIFVELIIDIMQMLVVH